MIAVSGTGFTEPAKRAAEKQGIELRTLEDWNFEAVKDWFIPFSFTFGKNVWEFSEPPLIKTFPEIRGSFRPSSPIFEINDKLFSMNELISEKVDELIAEKSIAPSETETVSYIYKRSGPIKLINNGQTILVTKIEAPIAIKYVEVRPELLLSLYRDSITQKTYVIGRCIVELEKTKFKILITGDVDPTNSESTKMSRLKGQFFTIDDKPYDTTGMRLTLYGYKLEVDDVDSNGNGEVE